MAFPSRRSAWAATNGSTAAATKTINYPATVVAGDTIICNLRTAALGAHTFPADWTVAIDNASVDQEAWAWKKADGTEGGGTFQVTSATAKFAALTVAFQGATDPTVTPPAFTTVATGSSNVPDPPSLTPGGGAQDFYWIWSGGWEGEQTSPPTGNPTNYADGPAGANSGTGGAIATNCRVAVAGRQLNAATEDPPTWTISVADDWMAVTVAIFPAPPAPTAITVADSGTGSDVVGVGVAVRQADAGQGQEAPSVPQEALRVVDAGAGGDVALVGLAVAVPDSGVSADAVQMAAEVPVPDSGSGEDVVQPASVAVPLSDSGSGTDSPVVSAQLGVVDQGAGDEVVLAGPIVSVADDGAGLDAPVVEAVVPVSDAGSGTDAVSVPLVSLRVVDEGVGLEDFSIGVLAAIADLGVGVDGVSIGASLSLSDQGVGVDASFLEAVIPVGDTGSGTDDVLVVTGGVDVVVADAGAGSEVVTVTGQAATVVKIRDRSRTHAYVKPAFRDDQ